MTPPKQRVPAPKTYPFTHDDQTAFIKRFWRCPVRLVTDGTWAKLWRRKGTKRGGGAATSILPILALHSYPEKEVEQDGWTEWKELPMRYIAPRAGLNKDTIRGALRDLRAARLLQLRRVLHDKERGLRGRRVLYRLSTTVFPRKGETEVAVLPGLLFAGGSWALLPTPACRHLYVVVACLDPIRNEDLYFEGKLKARVRAAAQGLGQHTPEELRQSSKVQARMRREVLARRRAEEEPVTLAKLVEMSGMQRSTVAEALRILRKPMPAVLAVEERGATGRRYTRSIRVRKLKEMEPGEPMPILVRRGTPNPRKPTWYAPDREAQRWTWPLRILNSRVLREEVRARWSERQSAADSDDNPFVDVPSPGRR